MEAISCLVPELHNKIRSGCRMQLFEKTQCFYVATVNFIVYIIILYKFIHVLNKKQLGSRQRELGKTAVIKAGAYIVSMDRKTTVYGLEAGKIMVLKNVYKLSTATRSRLSLACL